MPVSHPDNIAPILGAVFELQPRKVMELGVGFGKYGVLLREVLDAVYGRCRPDQWRTVIHGVEAFEPYKNPCWAAYNRVQIADFGETYQTIKGYGLVLMVDSLEHLAKPQAYDVLAHLVASNATVMVSVPIGEYKQGPVYGNRFEAHRSTWTASDFERFNCRCIHMGVCGVFVIPRQ